MRRIQCSRRACLGGTALLALLLMTWTRQRAFRPCDFETVYGDVGDAVLASLVAQGEPFRIRESSWVSASAAHRWSLAAIKQTYGRLFVQVGSSTGALEREEVRLGHAMHRMEQGEDLMLYVPPEFLEISLSELLDTLTVPAALKSLSAHWQHVIMIAAPRSGVAFHDHNLAMNIAMSGVKRWFMYPPTLLTPPLECPGLLQRGHLSWLERFLRSADVPRPLECTQEKGDVIFIPEGWHHMTIHDEMGSSVSVFSPAPVTRSTQRLRKAERSRDERTSSVFRQEVYRGESERHAGESGVAVAGLGETLMDEGRSVDALEVLARGVKHWKWDMGMRIVLARVQERAGDLEGALQSLADVHQHNGECGVAWLAQWRVLMRLGRRVEAESALRVAERLPGTDVMGLMHARMEMESELKNV